MNRTLLVSGKRADFTTLALDLDRKELSITANYAAPYNASWTEISSSHGDVDRLVGVSEVEDAGLFYTFEIDHAKKTCKITSQQPTLGSPGHFTTLQDKSALGLITYWGGSVAFYPISITAADGLLLTNDPRVELLPGFTYKSTGHGPNEARQAQSHPHQMLEDRRGFIYVPDLGSDRVWIIRREKTEPRVCGWFQCPAGMGPRHIALTPDDKIMYVIGELSHTVLAFDLATCPAEGIKPIDGFAPNIIPPSVHPDHQTMMDSAELCLHPSIPNVLYASNRLERHILKRQPHLENVPEPPSGDAIAIILLSDDGRGVQEVKFVRTNLDCIRGMRISDDGRYIVAAGQQGGGIEVYGISGERGDVWTLVARLDEGLEAGIKHAIWL